MDTVSGHAMTGVRDAKAIGKGLAGWQLDLSVRLLRSEPGEDLPVDLLARRCGLSRSHFGRAFKISTGHSPHRWLIRYRLLRAQEMLEWTDESIVAIALACGFADQSHFTRMFRAVVGASPAAWRRERRARFPQPPF